MMKRGALETQYLRKDWLYTIEIDGAPYASYAIFIPRREKFPPKNAYNGKLGFERIKHRFAACRVRNKKAKGSGVIFIGNKSKRAH